MPEDLLLSGWGRTAPTRALLVNVNDKSEVANLIDSANSRGVIARGLGRSYGDAAQCAGGTAIALQPINEIGEIDPESGTVEVGGGTSLDSLVRELLPKGWFLPVTPGTRQVTIGGAIAADVHGKNHHRDGSFINHIQDLDLATPTGSYNVGPGTDSELFWASAGGMGLTGVITRATIKMMPVETDKVVVDTDRFDDLDAVMSAMEQGDSDYRYSVAWVDCTARGRRFGRSVLTRGDHAGKDSLPVADRNSPLSAPRPPRITIPRPGPRHLLNPLTISAFNELWFRRSPRRRRGKLQPLAQFFHPLDGVANWNLLYGDRGFVQYQFVVGLEHAEVVEKAITLLTNARIPSFLAVLKRFGPASPGHLSFPFPGWTLALDLPLGPPQLSGALDRLDEMVAAAGGRVYLAKDARLRPELVATMYPRLEEFMAVRNRIDPRGVLRSDLGRRLGIA
jgi:decaprenylphospho-beta-D-ribofuranose 2-oxidase